MAERLFQVLGDQLTKALVGGDFALYESLLMMPVKFTPRGGGKPYVLTDRDALREDFDLYVSIIRVHGVTDIYREILGIETLGPEDIIVRVTTHIMVRAQRLVAPFETAMHLRKGPGGWRIAEIESSEGHLNWSMGNAELSPDDQFGPKKTED